MNIIIDLFILLILKLIEPEKNKICVNKKDDGITSFIILDEFHKEYADDFDQKLTEYNGDFFDDIDSNDAEY